ncbi:MAG TPA: RNA polymerase sigma factor [Pseudolabrys sp.]|jgi:RNA polymerase sigma-70 factor (ECF subfamily)|nr:RNA polymerase sigma factor [Pseudolabrys sp.]
MTIRSAATPLSQESDLIARARANDHAAIRTIIRQNNRRLFRVARSILKNDWEAEDAVQEAYVRAFTHLSEFEGKSSLNTWLTRIVVNEALGRLRRHKPTVDIAEIDAGQIDADGADIVPFPLTSAQPDPERSMAQAQIRNLLEEAIDALPDPFRVVLVARVIEEMSVEETAELYGLKPETVKTRLHRARAMLRRDLEEQFGPLLADTYPFGGRRCERMADNVIARLEAGRQRAGNLYP